MTKSLFTFFFALLFFGCNAGKNRVFKPKVLYKSDELVITQISENAFAHTSYLQTNDFGRVPCNGLIVRIDGEAIIFDTPADDYSSQKLIGWVNKVLDCKINAIIPTHFHNDCLGGLKAFHQHHIPSYAYAKTINLAKENNYEIPQNGFTDSLRLPVGKQYVSVRFFGEGHTRDNVVGYYPAEEIMFGGCLIKELKAGKGFLGDANVAAWPETVAKVKAAYPHVRLIVPGHGAYGNKKLLDYTIELFKGK